MNQNCFGGIVSNVTGRALSAQARKVGFLENRCGGRILFL